ncbi:MAG TPA: ABC transporter permease [Gemmatimonadaceae bacterium]|nr:ABC transporter permease [Gemmatimonadaceae bacterium]
MRRYIAARLLQSVIVVLLVTTISFFLVRLAPGDPFSFVGDFTMSATVRDQLRAQFGYDKPMIEQFALFLGNVAHGRLGYSQSMHRYVGDVLIDVLPRTLLLMGVALVLAFVIGVAAGALQALRRQSWLDRALSGVLLLFYSIPDFWLALMALLALAYWLPIFPAGGMIDQVMHDYMSLGGRVRDIAAHLILPSITLALLTAAGIARYQRAALLDVLPQDFVRTARAKGLGEGRVVLKHALRNALLPVITLIGLMLPALVGGAFFIEKVFAWPGMGYVAANAIAARDYDLVTGSVIVGGIMVTIGSLLADLLYAVADPRLRAR